MVVATMRPTSLADFQANLPAFSHPLLATIAAGAAPHARPATPPSGAPIFTDDLAPVEWIVHSIALRAMLGGE
jgi:hypothetical protein